MTREWGNKGFKEGFWCKDRKELSKLGLHGPPIAGISGGELEGADSVVLNGGYEDDDIFNGDEVIYTGAGKRDLLTRKQVGDQELKGRNKALKLNIERELPVRVIVGSGCESDIAPESGYIYVGLYKVESYWEETGASGYRIYRFKLLKINSEEELEFEERMTKLKEIKSNKEELTQKTATLPVKDLDLIEQYGNGKNFSAKLRDLYGKELERRMSEEDRV